MGHSNATASKEPRRIADPLHATSGTCRRQGSFCGRSGGLCDRGNVAQAKDAAEAVTIDIDPLPVVLTPSDAVKAGAPLVFDAVPNNIALDYHYGDAAKVAEAFAKAKHVTRLETSNQRMVVNAMEPRAAIGEYDTASDKWTLYSRAQGVHGMKTSLMDILSAPADKVRVVTGQVGGSFGMKASVYPEYICLLHAARVLGCPVKWTDERSGSFLSDHHGRAQDMVMEMAFDETRISCDPSHRLRRHGRLSGTVRPDCCRPAIRSRTSRVFIARH